MEFLELNLTCEGIERAAGQHSVSNLKSDGSIEIWKPNLNGNAHVSEGTGKLLITKSVVAEFFRLVFIVPLLGFIFVNLFQTMLYFLPLIITLLSFWLTAVDKCVQ